MFTSVWSRLGSRHARGGWGLSLLVIFLAVEACSGDGGLPSTTGGASSGGGAAAGGAATGGAGGEPQATPPMSSPDPSLPQRIGLRVSKDPQRPYQHGAEVTVAAWQGHVVIAAINIHTDSGSTLEAQALLRGVGVAVSHDFGETFTPMVDPGFEADIAETSDPVVRVGVDGTFWLSAMAIVDDPTAAVLYRSTSQGDSWGRVAGALSILDKEWLAPMPDGGIAVGGVGGLWRFSPAGEVVASWVGAVDWPVMGAFGDETGAHFVFQYFVGGWDGGMAFTSEGGLSDSASQVGWSVPIGKAMDGNIWSVYELQSRGPGDEPQALVEARLFPPGDTTGEVVPISEPGTVAFLPGAAMDDEGRLHVIWYESSGSQGVLKYARSRSSDLREGFAEARVVDEDACPGAGWVPSYAGGASDRRLREYIDVAIDGRRVHAVWTHAPTLPSAIFTSHWDF